MEVEQYEVLTEWEIIKSQPSLRVQSKVNEFYCNTRYIIALVSKVYSNGVRGIKLVNQLVWLNYSMYPYFPPKLSFTISILLVCVFLMNSR
jgi:hypothetical protein